MHVLLLSLKARFDTCLDVTSGIFRMLYMSWLALVVSC